ncbi:squalene monooxygenase [Metschnikowia bicuspidata var. bicuspidata NRRL YB-4993]|uniref:Squalene monooxygenase n=1 Tax=Metschnikowia bicuspidata var. bicuspidata NRRL YB-4993 TaxID=869754 RepID=A0A1A0HKA8_9ASCO|nr:squalene monooxygenase [Metschnikowia bicuspidata var. bicuspidata NRRL YB-4993]OBA24238.1 squalene monooxygenase [Metschnikowia bicuspidata var. bicuspidata NRRL YB-4993]
MLPLDAIVIGAGVVGPALATALARQGHKVLIIERDWSEPDRIVGELMQPAGVKALRELGLVQALNNIDARHVDGYYIKYHGTSIVIDYASKETCQKTAPVVPVPDCVFGGNDKLSTHDPVLLAKDWDAAENVRGVSLTHGKFLLNLRRIVRSEPNVTWVEGTATALLRAPGRPQSVVGVRVKTADGSVHEYRAKMTFACDGIYLKFRKEHLPTNVPTTGLYFVGLALHHAELPAPNHGHVILGSHAPVLVYQVSAAETRMLCAYRSTRPPSLANDDFVQYLRTQVLPNLPRELHASFEAAVAARLFRAMPNQYLTAPEQGRGNEGFVMLGDALNMRHPLTGGGMTVGLNDTALLARLLHGVDLGDQRLVDQKLRLFHRKRKNLDAVINVLSIALYSLFAADTRGLQVLQRGCFEYFLLGGDCVDGPMGLLSGMMPFPMMLFNHFFSVAFYAIYVNFVARGVTGFPVALYEAFDAFYSAVVVFTPYLWKELVR